MILKIIQDLRKIVEAKIETQQEMFNKDRRTKEQPNKDEQYKKWNENRRNL